VVFNAPPVAPLQIAPVEHPVPPPPAPPAVQPPAPPKPPAIITKPDWVRLPGPDEYSQYYPERASRLGVGGRVTLSCSVNANGTLSGCEVASESPSDQEFGSAALKMSKYFKMRPMTQDGQPVAGAKITIPLTFKTAPPE
jgi:protein TonB